MKSNLFSALLFLIPILIFSQTSNDKTVYLDSLWQETSQGNHKYYRVIKDYYTEKDNYKIVDYYKNDKPKKEYTRNGKDGGAPIGEETSYYENGSKLKVVFYDKGRPTGKTTSWYENGNIKEEGEYTGNFEQAGKHYKMNQFWDENKNHLIVDGNGVYMYKSTDYVETGNYLNGFKDGNWEAKNLRGKTSNIEKYDSGKFVSGTIFFADNTKKEYLEIETRPQPKKGMQDFYSFIGKNFSLTKEAKKNNVKGKIFVQFVVDKEGQIVEPKVIKGLGYGLDEEAIRVLLKYGDWIPGEQRGRKVRCKYSMPIAITTQ